MMLVGYPANQDEDFVRMWSLKTNGNMTTRDVNVLIWMKRIFYKKPLVYEIEIEPLEARSGKEAENKTIGAEKHNENSEVSGESEARESVHQDASASTRLSDRSGPREPDRLPYNTLATIMIGGMSDVTTELRLR